MLKPNLITEPRFNKLTELFAVRFSDDIIKGKRDLQPDIECVTNFDEKTFVFDPALRKNFQNLRLISNTVVSEALHYIQCCPCYFPIWKCRDQVLVYLDYKIYCG